MLGQLSILGLASVFLIFTYKQESSESSELFTNKLLVCYDEYD